MTTTAGTSAPERLFNGWHTSVDDGRGHAVTDAAFAEGVRQRRGEFATVCGQVIRVAALVAPCGRACPGCAEFLRMHTTSHLPADDGPPRRLRWLWRLTGRHAFSAATHAEPGA